MANPHIISDSFQEKPTVAVSFVDAEPGPPRNCLTVILGGDFYGYPPSWDRRKNLYCYLFSYNVARRFHSRLENAIEDHRSAQSVPNSLKLRPAIPASFREVHPYTTQSGLSVLLELDFSGPPTSLDDTGKIYAYLFPRDHAVQLHSELGKGIEECDREEAKKVRTEPVVPGRQ